MPGLTQSSAQGDIRLDIAAASGCDEGNSHLVFYLSRGNIAVFRGDPRARNGTAQRLFHKDSEWFAAWFSTRANWNSKSDNRLR